MFKTRKRKLTFVALGLTAIGSAGAYAYSKFKNE